ncbi:MAG: ATP-dependent Clp protease adaptor ClpS [Dehalococcoidia bacterium]|nr:ATP-dependent Clp protease adaptor ClpS [Dehalococcoidia bacterium]
MNGARTPSATSRPASTPARTARPARTEEPAPQPVRAWRVVLIDDDDHSYEYVIEMLAALFGYGREKAFALARIVDTAGRVTLMTADRAECDAKQRQVHAYGADPRIPRSRGSMTALVEEADTPFA